MPRTAENLIGKKFGRLTVINRAETDKKGVWWNCQCECGNIKQIRTDHLKKGDTVSCGCKSKETLIKYNQEIKANNLLGQKFGKLTVIEKTDKRNSGAIVWKCKCECGKITYVRSTSLKSGDVKSCGCSQEIDITNKHFGKLIAIRKEGPNKWLCKCECGNEKIIDKAPLLRGDINSCGCLKMSKGELKISYLLEKNKIPFEQEKIFLNCKFPNSNGYARFDFFVDNKYLIEYDGIQHFIKDSGYGADLENIQKRDAFKNAWTKEKNIPLIRIPYTHYDDLCLEDLLLETSSFII